MNRPAVSATQTPASAWGVPSLGVSLQSTGVRETSGSYVGEREGGNLQQGGCFSRRGFSRPDDAERPRRCACARRQRRSAILGGLNPPSAPAGDAERGG